MACINLSSVGGEKVRSGGETDKDNEIELTNTY